MWGLKEQLAQDLPDPYFGEIRWMTSTKKGVLQSIIEPLSRYGTKYILIHKISFVPAGTLQRLDMFWNTNLPLFSVTDTQAIAPIQGLGYLIKAQTLHLTLAPAGILSAPTFSVSFQWIAHNAQRNENPDPKAP